MYHGFTLLLLLWVTANDSLFAANASPASLTHARFQIA
jgi:hypothetical protein